jgi:hypothetical protein
MRNAPSKRFRAKKVPLVPGISMSAHASSFGNDSRNAHAKAGAYPFTSAALQLGIPYDRIRAETVNLSPISDRQQSLQSITWMMKVVLRLSPDATAGGYDPNIKWWQV